MRTLIGAKIYDPKTSRLIRNCRFKKAHSFVGNFLICLFDVATSNTLPIIDTGGTSRSIAWTTVPFQLAAAANGPTAGIQIGSGTNPVTLADKSLQTQITTNVYHLATNVFLNSPSLSSMEMIINRGFLNNTGGNLTINEVGLVAFNSAPYNFLLDRTLYTIVVGRGLAVTFTYKIGITL